jgi:hypothetical protein
LHALVTAADVQDRDGGALLLSTLFGQFPLVMPSLVTEIACCRRITTTHRTHSCLFNLGPSPCAGNAHFSRQHGSGLIVAAQNNLSVTDAMIRPLNLLIKGGRTARRLCVE